jgi:hypothetical protein
MNDTKTAGLVFHQVPFARFPMIVQGIKSDERQYFDSAPIALWRRAMMPWTITVIQRATQKPANSRLGLPDVHARDGARDDQALNLRSPFEDRVDL